MTDQLFAYFRENIFDLDKIDAIAKAFTTFQKQNKYNSPSDRTSQLEFKFYSNNTSRRLSEQDLGIKNFNNVKSQHHNIKISRRNTKNSPSMRRGNQLFR